MIHSSMRAYWMMCLSAVVVVMVLTFNTRADSSLEQSGNFSASKKLLSRRKRYIVFPKGSSLQLVFCFTQFIVGSTIFKLGTTAGLAWMLPDDPNLFLNKNNKHKMKRSIYQKVESYMNVHEMNGKECILRALCESGQRTSSKKPFVQEILHKIFSLESESEFEEEYFRAHRSVNSNCTQLYPDCPFSLFSLPLSAIG